MSLTQVLRAGVETAFDVANEMVRVGTYVAKGGNPDYDPEDDTLAGGETQVPNVRFLQTTTTLEEREASPVQVSELKFLIPFVDLQAIIPSQNDQIILDGVKYNVLSVKPVPGQALHVVFARKA